MTAANPEEIDVFSPPSRWVRTRTLVLVAQVCVVLAWGTELVRATVAGPAIGGYVAVALSVAGVALDRRVPMFGLVLVGAAPLTASLWGWEPITTWTVTVFFVFIRTLRGQPALVAGVLLAASNFVAVALFHDSFFPAADALSNASIAATSTIAGTAIGSALRARQRFWEQLQQRARDALATRDTEANRRVAQERLRIARDLHDVMGHEVAVISVHLGIAESALPPGSEAAQAALVTARQGVQSVLRETQQILDVLRFGDADGAAEPPAAFARIPDLVASFRSLGLDVQCEISPATVDLDPAVSTAAYRTAQEMLTNAHRHSAGAVSLRVELKSATLTIEAENQRPLGGSVGESAGRGYGLVGMRERVQSAGGDLVIDDGRQTFRVLASFPVRR